MESTVTKQTIQRYPCPWSKKATLQTKQVGFFQTEPNVAFVGYTCMPKYMCGNRGMRRINIGLGWGISVEFFASDSSSIFF